VKTSFDLFGQSYIFYLQKLKKPHEWTCGITSRIVGTNLHILLMDYDIIREDYLMDELEYLQDIFRLGNFYVFRTRLDKESSEYKLDGVKVKKYSIGGYHCICLDVDTLRNNLLVLRSSSSDYAFINAPSYNPEKHWVLRMVEKGKRGAPEYIGVVESEYEGEKPQSLFHARILDDMFDLKIEQTLKNPLGNEDGILDYYNTAKRV
jgi:hypothetical protein